MAFLGCFKGFAPLFYLLLGVQLGVERFRGVGASGLQGWFERFKGLKALRLRM